MATSGNFITSDSGQGGGGYYSRMIFEWWRTGWGRSGSVGYHNIAHHLKSWDGNTTYWQYFYNGSMNVDGNGYSWGTTKVYGGGATVFGDYGLTLYTDSAGNRSFGASAQGGIYTAAINTSGSGSWALDNIPMHSAITNASGDQNDEVTAPWVEFSNPAGTAVDVYIELPSLGGGAIAQRTNVGSRYTWTLTTTELNTIRALMASVNSTTIRFVVHDSLGGVNSWTYIDRTISIINGNPVFTTVTYKDANSTTTAITGNDQYIIQGYSTLEVGIASGNKAVAQKSATMTKYNMVIGSINQDVTYVTTTIAQNLGTVGLAATADLVVKAIDSRNNFTAVTKSVNILPYQVPQVTATARRVNNFETLTDIHIEGIISRLTIAGTDKNAVNSTSGVQYRYKKTTDVSWGSWTNRTSSVSAGAVSTTDFQLSLDRNYSWNIQVKITDKLNTTTVDLLLTVGIPIFRVSTYDNLVYNNEQPLMVSHVGQIIMSTTLTTAGAVAALYGGTWVAWGVGRTLVGVDTSQTEFNTVEKTGGDKNLQAHSHGVVGLNINNAGGAFTINDNSGDNIAIADNAVAGVNGTVYVTKSTNSAGAGNSQNLQPYITAYMWKRTV